MEQCVVTKVEPAGCKTLETHESCLVRVQKASGLLDGAYGPELQHLWITEDGDWIGYIVQNPINGSPEGSFECYSSENKDKTKVYMSLLGKSRDTNFFESSNGRLSANYTRQGEDAIVWTITYK